MCMYHLKLSTKDIAKLLNVKPRTVRNLRYLNILPKNDVVSLLAYMLKRGQFTYVCRDKPKDKHSDIEELPHTDMSVHDQSTGDIIEERVEVGEVDPT